MKNLSTALDTAHMNPILQTLLRNREDKYPHELEQKFPRLFDKIMKLWGTAEIEPFFSSLFIDDTGNREGFPPKVMAEIFFLSTLHDEYLLSRQNQNTNKGDVWSNENVRHDLEGEHVEYSPRGFFGALDTGNKRAVEIFLEAGVDLEQKNVVGWTPLMVASFTGNEEIAALLVNAGANVNARDNRGYGPLHWAAFHGFERVTELLLRKGATAGTRSDKGLTPLLQASARGHAGVVRLLIAKGAAVNEPDEEGWTPLHKAVANGHERIVDILLENHADPYSRHKSGLTPADIARQNKNQEIIRKLTK